MCRLRNIALESVTEKRDRRMDRETEGRTTDKVIPMCCYASQATQKLQKVLSQGLHMHNTKVMSLVLKVITKVKGFFQEVKLQGQNVKYFGIM